MITRIQTLLQAECLLSPDLPVLAGVSGGPDSLCLMDLLNRLGYPLVVAHLDHGLRSTSLAESQKVQRMVESRGIPFILGREDIRQYAGRYSLSLEEAARMLRYRFLFQAAREVEAQAVAVGHTADDQVETVLMHLLRGAGLSGLKGMAFRSVPTAWSQDLPLVRPLLGIWREEVQAYVQERGLEPVYDASNLDTTFYRNRLRHELIPFLQTYNPHVRQALWRTAQVLEADYALVDKVVEEAWEACQGVQGPGYVALALQPLRGQPLGVQRHLLRRAIAVLRPGLRDVDFQTIERGLEALKSPAPRAGTDLAAGLRLLVENGQVWVTSEESTLPGEGWPQLPPNEVLSLEVPGSVQLYAGWQIQAEWAVDLAGARQQAQANTDPYQVWVAVDSLPFPLEVRTRQPGDRFKPLGMHGHSLKLSDFMINVKLPFRARQGWPLVVSGEEILWVPGVRLAHPARLTPSTQRVVHLHVKRSDLG